MMHSGGYTVDARIRWPEWLPWIAALAAFFALPEYLSLGARILIYILYALSLDLIVGYAGIITLGHSAYFGDRKSTRLNSSHLVISYAVFCLKKKKYKIPRCA